MRIKIMIMVCVIFACAACDKKPSSVEDDSGKQLNQKFHTDQEKLSYAMGFSLGKRSNQYNYEINPDIFLKGLQDGLNAIESPRLTEKEMHQVINATQSRVAKQKKAEFEKKSSENKAKGDRFRKENRQVKDTVTLQSGLQYTILKTGNGESPGRKDKVTCHYIGTTLDGVEFDNTYKKGQPYSFYLAKGFPGWVEALQLMKVGSKWRLCVPPHLAFGKQGLTEKIGPDETVIWEIELLGIEKYNKK